MGKETDDSATSERSRSLSDLRRRSADLLALAAQKHPLNRRDLYLLGGLCILLKSQHIFLNRQSPIAVVFCVRETEEMSSPNAELWVRLQSGGSALGQCTNAGAQQ